jgi:hypothetical protein
MSLPSRTTLVDHEGSMVPLVEKATDPEPDPSDRRNWPAWTDNYFWEVDDAERAALEAAEIERQCDLHDAPPLSAADRDDFHAWLDQLDAGYPPRDQVSPEELSMMSAGLPIG